MRCLALLTLPWLLGGGAALAQTTATPLADAALRLVNEDRQENGLPELTTGEALAAAAGAHASDMAERDFYAHVSPEGEDVQDRFLAQGGSRWELVAENIARCEGCTLDAETIAELQQGWMDSPEHRRNVLAPGLDRFGFGTASVDGVLYAVQTFAGAGTPRGLAAGESSPPVGAEEAARLMLERVNTARREAGVAELQFSAPLTGATETLLPAEDAADFSITAGGDIYGALPAAEQDDWRRLSLASGACGGCGSDPTETDVVAFADDWLGDPGIGTSLLDEAFTHLGFGIAADGRGKKVAVALFGEER